MTIIIVLDYEQSHLFGEVRFASKKHERKNDPCVPLGTLRLRCRVSCGALTSTFFFADFFYPRNGLRREGGTRSLILKFFYHRYYKNASSSLSSSISRNKFTNQFLYRCDKLYLPACTGFNRLFTVRCSCTV